MKFPFLKFVVLLHLLFTTSFIYSQSGQNFEIVCSMPDPVNTFDPVKTQTCDNSFTQFLSHHTLDMVPQNVSRTLKIRTNVIFVQNAAGEINFSINDQVDMAFWNGVFEEMNSRLVNLTSQSCNCSEAPVHYPNIHLEFVPNFIEVKDDVLWNHEIDNSSTCPFAPGCNSFDKDYLNQINDLAKQDPNYVDGFNAIITTGATHYNNWIVDTSIPIWDLNYISHYTNGNNSVWYSAFPTHDLDHPAMWHAPDLWLTTANCVEHCGGNWWLMGEQLNYVAGGFLHEYGHYFNLGHESCDENVMNPSSGTRTSFSGCQVRDMYETIMKKNLRKYVICEDALEHDITITQSEDWSNNLRIYGNIIIKDGSTLRISCELHMETDAEIIVEEGGKLIVDGGILTSCDKWRGIRVTGGNPDFDVLFTNDAIIENTSKAAVSMFPALSWTQAQGHGNGILHAENTTFNNCKRMVEFIAFSVSKNQSYINDCVQNGGKWGITNWNCQSIEVTNNVFNNVLNECIVLDNGSFSIDNNVFESGQNDILFVNTSAGLPSSITNNEFNGSGTGLRAIGSTVGQNHIFGNYFNNDDINIFLDGHNNYNIQKNELIGFVGAVNSSNGSQINFVRENRFTGNFAGMIPHLDNTGLTFYENCFNTANTDLHIIGDVASIVGGEPGNPANNCFTHFGNSNSSTTDIAGTPNSFSYLLPDDNIINCKDDLFFPPPILTVDIGQNIDPDCGLGNVIPIVNDPCNPEKNLQSINSSISWLLNKIDEIQNDPNLSSDQKLILLYQYRVCLKKIYIMLSEELLLVQQFQSARNTLLNVEGNDNKVFTYSTYIMEDDLINARSYLNAISSIDEELVDFKIVQNINLDRLEQGLSYEVSTDDLNDIYIIALKNHPYATYAKALYYTFTKEILSSEIPSFYSQAIQQRSNDAKEVSSFSVYPNPFQNDLNFDFANLENAELKVYDFNGKEVYNSNELNNSLTINTSNWISGLYLIKVIDNDQILFQEKLILIK